jgi:hypothetical protein
MLSAAQALECEEGTDIQIQVDGLDCKTLECKQIERPRGRGSGSSVEKEVCNALSCTSIGMPISRWCASGGRTFQCDHGRCGGRHIYTCTAEILTLYLNVATRTPQSFTSLGHR